MLNKYLSILFVSLFLIGCGSGSGSNDSNANPPKIITNGYSELIDSFADFGARDTSRLLKTSAGLLLFQGWYRTISVYQDAWLSKDSGQSWSLLSGNPKPLYNDLVEPIYYPVQDLPEPISLFVNFQESIISVSNGGVVWKSSDNGKTWARLADNVSSLSNISVTDKLVVNNGLLTYINTYDGKVSFSGDGVVWNGYDTVGLERLNASTLAQANNKLWIFGGAPVATGTYGPHNYNVWFSDDGIVWNKLKSGESDVYVPWPGRNWSCATMDAQGNVWMFGGYNNQNKINYNDVWYTTDFVSWHKVKQPLGQSYNPVHATSCVYLQEKKAIMLASGKGGLNPDNQYAATTNSVWYFYPDYR